MPDVLKKAAIVHHHRDKEDKKDDKDDRDLGKKAAIVHRRR
ncbi:MAG: hypothetical protein ACXV2E_07655 [Halobacteriota archaeon]